MKQLLLSLTILSCTPYLAATEYPTYAEIYTCLQEASPRDAQLLLNLAYWSFQRSKANIVKTDCIIKQVELSWMLWQNYTQTRLNPERKLPYPQAELLQTQNCNSVYQEHLISNACYSIMLEHILKKEAVAPRTLEFITTIRSQARMVVAQALWKNMPAFEGALGKLQATLAQSAQAFSEQDYTILNKNIVTQGINYIVDGVGLRAFVTFDRKYNENSDKLMQALIASQTKFHETWHTIEQSRAEFYRQLYLAIYKIMVELKFPQSSFMHAYNIHGFVAVEQQKELLPYACN